MVIELERTTYNIYHNARPTHTIPLNKGNRSVLEEKVLVDHPKMVGRCRRQGFTSEHRPSGQQFSKQNCLENGRKAEENVVKKTWMELAMAVFFRNKHGIKHMPSPFISWNHCDVPNPKWYPCGTPLAQCPMGLRHPTSDPSS